MSVEDQVTTFLQENLIFIYVAVWAFFMLYLLYQFQKGRGKILVRVKTPMRELCRWIKPNPDGTTVTMQKATTKKAGWTFKFSNKSLVPIKRFFGFLQAYAIDVFYESPKAIEYEYSQSEATQPKLTLQDVTEFNKADALKRRYSKMDKLPTQTVQIITVILIFVLLILQLLSLAGIRVVR